MPGTTQTQKGTLFFLAWAPLGILAHENQRERAPGNLAAGAGHAHLVIVLNHKVAPNGHRPGCLRPVGLEDVEVAVCGK